MQLKFEFVFVICLTLGINHIKHGNAETVEVCLEMKNVKLNISLDESTCEVVEIERRKKCDQADNKNPNLPITPSNEPKVEDGYIHTPGTGYHKFHSQLKTWHEARKVCYEEGGHLAIIDSSDERKVLEGMYKKNFNDTVNATSSEAYVGVHALFETGEWLTVLNKPVSSIGFNGWADRCDGMNKEPNNLPDYRCAAISQNCEGMSTANCMEKRAFFCEKPEDSSPLTCQALKEPKALCRADYSCKSGLGYHKFHTQPKTWHEARKVCYEEGGHLAIINSIEERKVLQNMYTKSYGNTSLLGAFVGVHSMFEKSEWLTVLNQPLSSINFNGWAAKCLFYERYPTNVSYCGVFMNNCEGMIDFGCDTRRPFFCEIPLECF